ncbi:MAG: M48 family metallopeptidase [Ekhidna sp.]|uniref:M48 family metallopeptidase n=1 Tax=Ekhidna sp. TaxID=2608089 RepID=UPI0032EB6322
MRKFASLTFILIAIFLIQCSSVPMSDRSQLSLISNDKIFPMSFEQYEQVKRESKIVTGTDEARMVKRVGTRIQRAVEQYFNDQGQGNYLADYQWEFNLIKNDSTVNAWCMPGGKVAFYTGIMPICKDELGVAVVMGHEIAHAIANHGRERISQGYAAQFGLSAVSIILTGGSGGPSIPAELIMQGAGAATSLGILAFSRKHESEADKLGLYFMAMAGYNPQEAPKFWERMSANSGGEAPPEFVSTHPSHDTRIADLKANMPKAMEYYKASN